MQRDAEFVADVVVTTLKAALAPVLERISAVETRVGHLAKSDEALGGLRERVAVVESKASSVAAPVDVGPVLERIAAMETRLQQLAKTDDSLGALLERVAVVESRPAIEPKEPEAVDLEPVFSRVNATDAKIAALESSIAADAGQMKGLVDQAVAPLRERLAVVESKAAVEPRVQPVADAWPVLERVATIDAKVAMLDEVKGRVAVVEAGAAQWQTQMDQAIAPLRERLVMVETLAKSVPAVATDPAVVDRLDGVESKAQDIRDRVVALETKMASSDVAGRLDAVDGRIARLQERQSAVDVTLSAPDPHTATIERAGLAMTELAKDFGVLRERVAAVEARAPIPGPQGPPGPPGEDGKDGQAGRDGLDGKNGTLENVKMVQVDERSVQFCFKDSGEIIEGGRFTFPVDLYRGVWIEGRTYEAGDSVTWAGAVWHCNDQTRTKPGEGAKAWTLKVKRGRDGRDGKDAPGALPVVSVGVPR